MIAESKLAINTTGFLKDCFEIVLIMKYPIIKTTGITKINSCLKR